MNENTLGGLGAISNWESERKTSMTTKTDRNHQMIDRYINGYKSFISKTFAGHCEYRLTPMAEPTAFARCFAIFGLHLVGSHNLLSEMSDQISKSIEKDLDSFRSMRLASGADLAFDKPYLQLLCFSLSALWILQKSPKVSLEEHIAPLVKRDILADLDRGGCLRGVPASGNQAMFMGIVNIYAEKWLNLIKGDRIQCWVDAHLATINKFGFWGESDSMTHLQFQNGYHQYEILEYLNIDNPKLRSAVNAVASLADSQGHFGPYPGGGGCYDYDAVAILTSMHRDELDPYRVLLSLTAETLISEQNDDGGFCDSKYMRPKSLRNIFILMKHIATGNSFSVKKERALLGLNLLRPRHNQIHTHWSVYSRDWGESNLWDSWFRMLTLARIQMVLVPTVNCEWGFIDFPGIGYVNQNHYEAE